MTDFIIPQKQCTHCKVYKSLTAFYRRVPGYSADGLDSWCKECKSEYQRTRKRPYVYDQGRHQSYYLSLKANGMCVTCKTQKARPNKVHCTRCVRRESGRQIQLKARAVEKGLCSTCCSRPSMKTRRSKRRGACEQCYLKEVMFRNLGSRKLWTVALDKLKEQNYRCAYTGEILVLGVNDSVDHINPVKRFPEQRNDPTNFEWVTRQINTMKAGYTKAEFLATIRLILSHHSTI